MLLLGAPPARADGAPQQARAQRPVAPLPAGVHRVPAAGRAAALVQEGLRGVVLDLGGVELRGQEAGGEPHLARGVGLLLRDCRDVTVLGGTFGGYAVCVLVEDSSEVRLESPTFDGWYAPLLSGDAGSGEAPEAGGGEPGPGAAVLIRRSMGVHVRDGYGRGGESGVRIESSSACSLLDSDFSFLARHGVSLWNARGCTVARNRLDYCLRDDGRLAAGIVLVQGGDHVVAFNRATHCQRGIAETRGSGNLLWRNDVSHARESGIEIHGSTATRLLENVAASSSGSGVRAVDCESFAAAANQIEDAAGSALRLESCRGSFLARNVLHGANIGAHVVSLAPQDGTTGPCPRSRGHVLWGNSFARNALDLMITRSGEVLLQDNVFTGDGSRLFATNLAGVERASLQREQLLERIHGVARLRPSGNVSSCTLRAHLEEPPGELVALLHPLVPPALEGSRLPPPRTRSGAESIFMGPWGPWDYEDEPGRPARPAGEQARR